MTTTSAVVTLTIENRDINQLPLNRRNFQLNYPMFVLGCKRNRAVEPTHASPTVSNRKKISGRWTPDLKRGTDGGNSVIGGGNLAGEGANAVPGDTIQEVTFIENPKAEYGWGTA